MLNAVFVKSHINNICDDRTAPVLSGVEVLLQLLNLKMESTPLILSSHYMSSGTAKQYTRITRHHCWSLSQPTDAKQGTRKWRE